MKVIQSTFFAFALLLSVSSAHSGPLEANDAFGTVIGAVGTYLPVVSRSREHNWVLIKVMPSPLSGFATPDGVHLSGSYTVVQTFGAAVASQSGTYSWPERNVFAFSAHVAGQTISGYSRWVESTLFEYPSDDQHSQKIASYLLCVLHEGATGQDKFTDVHLVPGDWQEDMLPAVLYLRTHPQLSDLDAAAPNLVPIRALLHNPNPYLVLTAVQLLAAHKNLTTADMDVALSSADARVVACSLAIAYFYSWVGTDANAQWLTDHVSKIKTLYPLEGIAVGTLVASPFNLMLLPNPTTNLPNVHTPLAATLAWQKNSKFEINLMSIIRQKLNEIDPGGGPTDARWRVIDNACQRIEKQTNIKFPNLQTNPNAR